MNQDQINQTNEYLINAASALATVQGLIDKSIEQLNQKDEPKSNAE